MPEEQQQDETQEASAEEEQIEANPVEFEKTVDEAPQSNLSLDLLMDISLPVTVELGRTSMTVEELLHLGTGSVVELDKMAGEPADLYVRDVRFARGEIVAVENNFGLKITQIIDRKHRIQELSGE
jgi:flagellar motor switch protein FliN/FliY